MKFLFSLWITPTPQLKFILNKIILDLAKNYGGPIFEPHLTLLGNVEMEKKEFVKRANKLALRLEPFALELGEMSFSTTYFQSVFLRIRSSAKLMEANLLAKKIYQKENKAFMPHISLLYGRQPMKVREKITSSVKLPTNLAFTAKAISLVSSLPNPKDWKHISDIPFAKPQKEK